MPLNRRRAKSSPYRLVPVGDGKFAVVTDDGTWVCLTTPNRNMLARLRDSVAALFGRVASSIRSRTNRRSASATLAPPLGVDDRKPQLE